jgi:hypothetical protein
MMKLNYSMKSPKYFMPRMALITEMWFKSKSFSSTVNFDERLNDFHGMCSLLLIGVLTTTEASRTTGTHAITFSALDQKTTIEILDTEGHDLITADSTPLTTLELKSEFGRLSHSPAMSSAATFNLYPYFISPNPDKCLKEASLSGSFMLDTNYRLRIKSASTSHSSVDVLVIAVMAGALKIQEGIVKLIDP